MKSQQRLVVHDTGGDPVRVLRRLDRREAGASEIVLVTHRPTQLPGALARRVRLVRERTPDAAARRAASLVSDGSVLITTAGGGDLAPVTIAASMIVKNEEQVIGACLEAITPFVDEVVVYDTGSTDATVAIARRAGATVVEGYWDDHFGDARNRAMDHCTSDWLIIVDADEVAIGDPVALRRRLLGERADALTVTVVSTTWSGATEGDELVSRRVVRRDRVRWAGALHEHMVPAEGITDATISSVPAPLRLLHSGYQVTVLHDKDKKTRNANIARRELDAAGEGREHVLAAANYGRSLLLAGNVDDGISVLEEVRESGGHPTTVVGAGRAALNDLVAAGRLDEARAWLPVMEEHGESHGNLCVRRAGIALAAGDLDATEEALGEAPTGPAAMADKDCWNVSFDVATAVGARARVDLGRGRADAALGRLRQQVAASPDTADFALLLTVIHEAGASWEEVVASVPDLFLERSVRLIMVLRGRRAIELGLRWCRTFIAVRPGDHRPLVAGCLLAAGCDLPIALTWSVIAREAGLPELCPVRRKAEQEEQATADRALLWALLADSFGEEDALIGFHATVTEMPDEEVPRLTSAMADLTPDLAHALFGAPTAS